MHFDGKKFEEWLRGLNQTVSRHLGVEPVNLTEHFLDVELGVAGLDERLIGNATFLCERILEPIRAHFGQPVRVHDGYRDPEHNTRVGGKPDSWHLYDGGHAAADIDVATVPMPEAFDWIRLESRLPFDKVIMETTNGLPATIHIQVDCLNAPRRLAYVGGTGDSHDYQQVMVA